MVAAIAAAIPWRPCSERPSSSPRPPPLALAVSACGLRIESDGPHTVQTRRSAPLTGSTFAGSADVVVTAAAPPRSPSRAVATASATSSPACSRARWWWRTATPTRRCTSAATAPPSLSAPLACPRPASTAPATCRWPGWTAVRCGPRRRLGRCRRPRPPRRARRRRGRLGRPRPGRRRRPVGQGQPLGQRRRRRPRRRTLAAWSAAVGTSATRATRGVTRRTSRAPETSRGGEPL